MAGAKAMAEAGVQPGDIGLMVNTSVSRAHLEPSTAVAVHHALGLPSSCQNFDVTNACLGFVNGMQLAAAMLESGQIDYALVVNGEDARGIHNATIARLQSGDGDAKAGLRRVRLADPWLRSGGHGARPHRRPSRGTPLPRRGDQGRPASTTCCASAT